MKPEVNHKDLYRLPWNYADNVITWLEPTKTCNIYCEGCYSANRPDSHKTMAQINEDLDVFDKNRHSHSVSIAGGEPLCHPEIEKVVKEVSGRGYKAIVNTNAYAMTPEIMHTLKENGLAGFTFHIDSLQTRKGMEKKNETELNEVRYKYAKMAQDEGGLSVSFNATVYEETLPHIPALVKWAQDNIDKVNVMVFICFRAAMPEFDYYAGANKIDTKEEFVYGDDKGRKINIGAHDVIREIRKMYPDFMPCAYLNGTADPSSFKWLMTLRFANKDKVFGYGGPKFMELAQTSHHFFYGTYQGYTHPKVMGRGRLLFLLSVFDKGVRKAFWNWIKWVLKNPFRIFKKVYIQSIMIIQPIDIMEDGTQSMCDGCPDMTAYKGKLVWSCRLEEPIAHGTFLTAVPKAKCGSCSPAKKVVKAEKNETSEKEEKKEEKQKTAKVAAKK